MSEFASAIERARKAYASIEQIEALLRRAPDDEGLQFSLAGMKKIADDSHDEVLRYSEIQKIEVCNYRLLAESAQIYPVSSVSRSLLEYQELFSQIHDANTKGPKSNLVYGKDVALESELQIAYTYSGSLGVVLLAPSDRGFFEGKLDQSINDLFEVMEVNSRNGVREIAQRLGNAVVKRMHDWSRVNLAGGFAADVRWNRSDGRQLGEVIPRKKMENVVNIIVATSDKKDTYVDVHGVLLGGDLESKTFHFGVIRGEAYRGKLAEEFPPDTDMTLGRRYRARIRETTRTVYALNKTESSHELVSLIPR
jgi:hypothetical protein